jgi:hypothetical protein
MNTIFGSRNGSGFIGFAGEGGYKTRPYEKMVFVGASDSSPVAIPPVRCKPGIKTGAGLRSRTRMVALRSEDTFHQVQP